MDKLFIDIEQLNELKRMGNIKPTNVDFMVGRFNCSDYNSQYKKIENGNTKKNVKIEAIKYVRGCFKFLEKEEGKPSGREEKMALDGFYYFHNMGLQDGQDVEIFAKALFKLLFERRHNPITGELVEKVKPLYIAVDFESKDYAREFIRIFSIFYIKNDQNKTSSYMTKVQIAVSSTSEKTGLKEVNFVLAGESLANAYATARNFVYYNADASLSFVPLLKFLSVGSEALPEPLFPFDLYLVDDSGISWFKKQMQHRLKTDLRTEEYGCKISEVKVRLGSKIHVDTFYEAELLLHNVGTVKRFAYLLAEEIIKDIKEKGDEFVNELKSGKGYLFLLGYENYSAVLMQEVHRLIKDYLGDNSKIEWLIDTRSEDFPVLSFDKFTVNEREKIFKEESIYCITILPLGSTMSTVYKLHESFERGLERNKKELKEEGNLEVIFGDNYCLVAIGDAFVSGVNEKTGIANNYLNQFIETHNFTVWQPVILQKQTCYNNGIKIKYLLSASATWKDLEDKKSIKESYKPLLKVDKTSTLIDAYFQTPFQSKVLKYYNRENKIKYLKPGKTKNIYCSYFKYGHILRGDNHYQFYFDFEKLTKSKRRNIERQAKQWKNDVQTCEAYNIVISPLQITNASFLDIVLNETFGSNLHLLHINIMGTGKENVRTKFEYIAQEFSQIIRQKSKINFYYVDDSVCTGNGLARAWKFLITLCNQSGVKIEDFCPDGGKFRKVFLLINRSSYETAQTWVKEPNKDWLGYINLCVPSYNTHMENNIATCPGCRVQMRYDLLRKRSTTNELVSFFGVHAKKHKARNPKEYDLWLEDQILESSSYFEWLRVWAYFKDKNGKIYKAIEIFYRHIKEGVESEKTEDFEKCLANIWGKQKVRDLIKQENIRHKVIDKIKEIIAADNYLRLETMDTAYRELLYDETLQDLFDKCRAIVEFTEYKNKLRDKIAKLLADCFNTVEDIINEDEKRKATYDAAFKFISYVKVISRDYLAKNYFIREAMYNVLHDIFNYMIIDRLHELKSIIKWTKINDKNMYIIFTKLFKIEKSLQYRIFKVITHRLALMHTETMFQSETILKTYRVFDNMHKKESEEELHIFLALPNEEDMILSHIASIKTATMEENNNVSCSMLWKQTEKIKGASD